MRNCEVCKRRTSIYTSFQKEDGTVLHVCFECHEKLHDEKIEADLESVKHPSDFKTWDMGNMSDAFWLHLARYKKKPNRKSLEIIRMALLWAWHADHGLSSSFTHALKWCGIDTFEEQRRKDLPDTDKED